MAVFIKNACSFFRHSSGMTLIEVLISLSVLFVSSVVIVQVLPLWEKKETTSNQEIQMFFQQLQEDMNYAYELEIKENGLILKETRNERQYSLSDGRIIRRKNGTGHEIVLQDVKDFSAAAASFGAEVSVVDRQGAVWSGVIGRRPLTEKENVYWVKREP